MSQQTDPRGGSRKTESIRPSEGKPKKKLSLKEIAERASHSGAARSGSASGAGRSSQSDIPPAVRTPLVDLKVVQTSATPEQKAAAEGAQPGTAALFDHDKDKDDKERQGKAAGAAGASKPVSTAYGVTNWSIPVVNSTMFARFTGPSGPNAIIYDATWHKVYVAMTSTYQSRENLLVFDTDANGHITSILPRTYRDCADPLPVGAANSYVQAMVLNRAKSKLYLALGTFPALDPTNRCLSYYSLDATGEPTGTVGSYCPTMAAGSIFTLALHPTLQKLYVGDQSDPNITTITLDANGVPTSSATLAGHAYGAWSMDMRSDGSKLYVGVYDYAIGVCAVDASGNLTTYTEYAAGGTPVEYMRLAVNDKSVYWRQEGPTTTATALNRKVLTAAGVPIGGVVTDNAHLCFGVKTLANGNVLLAQPATFTDAITGTTITSGMKVVEYSVTSAGAINAAVNTSPDYDHATFLALADGTAAVGRGHFYYTGNRMKGLNVRLTPQSMSALPGSTTGHAVEVERAITAVGDTPDFYKIAYSSARNRVYGVDPGTTKRIWYATPGSAPTYMNVANAQAVFLDETMGTYGCLYIVCSNNTINVKDLSSTGVPEATGVIVTLDFQSTWALAFHPTTHKVYAFGTGGTSGPCSGSTEALRTIQISHPTCYMYSGVVDATKNRLYATGGYGGADGNHNLNVYTLNADGTLPSYTSTEYADGIPITGSGQMTSISLNGAKKRLYITGYGDVYTGQAYLIVRSLNTSGDPDGGLTLYPGHPTDVTGICQAGTLSPDAKWFFEGGNTDTILCVHRLDDTTGDPTGVMYQYTVDPTALWYSVNSIKASADGTKILIGSYGEYITVPTVASVPKVQLTGSTASADTAVPLGDLKVGVAGTWADMDSNLREKDYPSNVQIGLNGGVLGAGNFKVEFATKSGTTYTTIATQYVDVQGSAGIPPAFALNLPGYSQDAAIISNLASHVFTDTALYTKWLNFVTAGSTPTQFLVGNEVGPIAGYCGNKAVLDLGMQLLHRIGMNVAKTGSFEPISPAEVKTVMTNAGITKGVKWSVYNPPAGYMRYADEYFGGPENTWAASYGPMLSFMGWQPTDIVWFCQADEPSWDFPAYNAMVNGNTTYHTNFTNYLSGKGLTPRMFGHRKWADVPAINISEASGPQGTRRGRGATTAQKKRLLYWTIRFYGDSNVSVRYSEPTTGSRGGAAR